MQIYCKSVVKDLGRAEDDEIYRLYESSGYPLRRNVSR
jgi:hypothetical protein